MRLEGWHVMVFLAMLVAVASVHANRGATPRARQAKSSSYSGAAAKGPRSGLSVYRTS